MKKIYLIIVPFWFALFSYLLLEQLYLALFCFALCMMDVLFFIFKKKKEQEKDHKNNQCGNQADVAHPAGNIGLLNVGERNSLGLKPVINNGISGKVQEREAESGDDHRNKEQTENF